MGKKPYKTALFIFRRDLRIHDNTGLLAALDQSESVIPCFVFDPRQIGNKNSYRSTNCMQFMLESLQELDSELKKRKSQLITLMGEAENVIAQLLKKLPIEAVFINKDYTPFSIKRDKALERACKKSNCDFYTFDDALLVAPEKFANKQGKPYTVFTPFFKAARQKNVPKPVTTVPKNFYTKNITLKQIDLNKELTKNGSILKTTNPELLVHGGRKESTKILNKLSTFKNYKSIRDYPHYKTTELSAYNKFGTHSIREVYFTIKENLGSSHELIKQLYWRDFFTHIAFHFPHVFGKAFHEQYNNLEWTGSSAWFKKWCDGKTGFPIVDAGMRQLNTTGYMHNRVRMVVASFLTKDLHINWRKGEKYFAQQLVDYDPAVNNGNWQWAASTGCDAQPYFRIFNPWLQQKRFDPQCEYIKTWIPELKDYSAKEIHNHLKNNLDGYLKPMIDHDIERKKTLTYYKNARK